MEAGSATRTITLTADELTLVRRALESYLEEFGREQADIVRSIKELQAKLPE